MSCRTLFSTFQAVDPAWGGKTDKIIQEAATRDRRLPTCDVHESLCTERPYARRGACADASIGGMVLRLLAALLLAVALGLAPQGSPVRAVTTAGATVATVVAKDPGAAVAGRWSWPSPPPHRVVTPYEAPSAVWSPGHRGIDVASMPGVVVVAPEAGVVHFAGTVVDRQVLSLEHAGGVLSSFEPVRATVARGQHVDRGQPIGVVEPGHCASSEPCFHLGARVDGRYVSPLLLLGELRRSVLLPTRPL